MRDRTETCYNKGEIRRKGANSGMRWRWLIGCLIFSIFLAMAEEAPPTMRTATSVEQAESCLIVSEEGEGQGVQRGMVRYVSQGRRDSAFCLDYWRSGEEKGLYDLTAEQNRYGVPYDFYVGTMCTRAVYSMALSYLGVDVTPVMMSEMVQSRNLNEPYEAVTALLPGMSCIGLAEATFDVMVDNYLTDEACSPLYVYLRRADGTGHALLLVGKNQETKRFLAVDPFPRGFQGATVRIYEISFSWNRGEVMKCAYNVGLEGAKVLQVYQWHLDEDAVEDADRMTELVTQSDVGE